MIPHECCLRIPTLLGNVAAQAGLEDSVIKSLGRWNSDAFYQYIRMQQEQLATYSRALAETTTEPQAGEREIIGNCC